MKPIYQGCMEKGIQHVATHAAEVAVGSSSSTTGNSRQQRSQRSPAANGKVKSS